MSHIDEGELTAYADGAYAPDTPDAQRIALHLAACENCRNRLTDAQQLSARAGEVLSYASPEAVVVPAFESLQPRRTRRVIPLAWAATVVMAVGLGWLARAELGESPTVVSLPTAAPEPQAPVSQAPAAPAAHATVAAAPPAQESKPRAEARRTELRKETNQAVAQSAQLSEREAAAADRRMLAPSNNVPASASRVAGEVAGAAAAPMAAPPPSAANLDMAARKSLADESIEYITAAEAERRKIKLLSVPALEVLRVGLRGSELIVEQKLPDAIVIEVHSRNGAVTSVTGPLTADSLRSLIRKVR